MLIISIALGFAARGAINVDRFGAKPDGVTDNTAAFQRALNAAAKENVATVDVPAGNYLFKGQLTIPAGITLEGSWTSVPSHPGLRDKGELKPTDGGTTFLIEGEKGTSYDPVAAPTQDKAFLNLSADSTLKGVVFYYPQQVTQSAPVTYPYTVALRGNNCTVANVELLNSYDGIDATNCARFLIRNVDGQPLHRGVVVDSIYDIGRIENVHFNPWFSIGTPVFNWEMEHGVAFEFARSDWQYVLNTFCFGYHVGYLFTKSHTGVCNGNFVGIGADNCNNAIRVEDSATYGLLITNGEFTSFNGANPSEVVVGPKNSGVVRFMNCAFWGPSDEIAHLEGTGLTSFVSCSFCQWDGHHQGLPAVDAVTGKIIVTSCDFQTRGKTVVVGSGVKKSVVEGNIDAN